MLDDGTVLKADVVVVGAGVVPATGFIKAGPVQIARDQSIVVDQVRLYTIHSLSLLFLIAFIIQFLRAAEGLYAAGDVARYPYFLTGESIRVEHWGMAQTQGNQVILL